ncbi:MAG: hypothetical protein KKC29_11570 [Alphaproteobacteria bacterium]|nr:hypothetical protein [Alphaproteobacteria bacterium]MBU2291725.1 hypothetical protein [Alphaproteobacteria bacterium]MBU2417668.1 hypothetical protein [Alphaproteobacteria bacterium]
MILTTLAMLATVALADPDPLAPARDGQLQCYHPDLARKTCQAIGTYRFGPDGVIWNDIQNMLTADPSLVLYATGKVYIRNGAECDDPDNRAEQITAIEVDGVALDGEAFLAARKQLADDFRTNFGDGEFCSRYHPNPDGTLRAVITVGGVERPRFETTLYWIDAADGWTLAVNR